MQDLVTAIDSKYNAVTEDEEYNDASCVIYVPKTKIKASQSGCLIMPERLTMEDCSICKVGDQARLKDLCQTVQELDLSRNCLHDWKEVITILENIPKMTFLNLSSNPLKNTSCPEDKFSFPNLSHLVLNSTRASWKLVSKVLSWFPNLKELHLSLMDFTCIELPENVNHVSLQKLYLNECNICDWAEISKLGHAFPNLEYLNLLKIGIKSLGDIDQYNFPSLRSLNISGTELDSWSEIDKFRCFPSLTQVRLTGLPLFKDWDQKERRQHIIARLPNISVLNGSPVSDTEREDAERAFIRYYMEREHKNERYNELEAAYGKLDPLVELDLTPHRNLKVLVKDKDKEETVEVDSYMTVVDLKKILKNIAGMPSSKFNLFIKRIARGEVFTTEVARPLDKQIYRFNLQPEDIIEIVHK